MKVLQSGFLSFLACCALVAQTTPDVGTGSPNETIHQSFINNYFRNGFFNLVSLPPLADVKKLGTQGLVQEFADAAKNQANKYALVKANAAAPIVEGIPDVVQLYPALYSYYTSVGATTAGYPTTDTLNCPALAANPNNSCQYQLFDKPYALFVYKATLASGGTNFATRNPFYTKWQSLGAISSLGPAAGAEQTVTSSAGTTATEQIFDKGTIFNITSGTFSGRIVAVGPVVFPLYSLNNGAAGFLGLPTSDEIALASGSIRQTFEGGAIEYIPGNAPTLRYPVQSIALSPSGTLKLNLGDTRTLQATLSDPNGNPLTDRSVSWSTSNLRIVSIQPSGLTAAITAVGGGTATVTAVSEGKTSAATTIFVTAPCCGIGEGAPTPVIQQAFLDVVSRNRLKLQLPTVAPVSRAGSGFVQDFQDASGLEVLLTVSDRSLTAGYAISGALLDAYRSLGGTSGTLGYPSSDATPGGRQLFENQAALAGSPPRLVTGIFLSKWASLGYETGVAGSPASAVVPVLTFRATLGQMQTFTNGALLASLTGPQTGKVYFVSGLVLAAYNQSGGATGQLGLPLNDEFAAAGKRRQDFEGGYIDYASGDAIAQTHPSARTPLVTATPGTIVAGGHVRLAVGGFNPSSTLKVSVTGQPDFVVQTDNGAYAWEIIVPAGAKSGVVSIHVADTGGASADGSYTVRAASETVLQISKVSGDGQTGLPGSILLRSLSIIVRDDAGNPVVGTPVTFMASPGSQVAPATAITDANGQAQATLRLPPADGVVLATAQAGRQFVTFSAQAVHSTLAGFPSVSQALDSPLGNGPDTIAQKGALLASLSAILRYYQNRGELPNSNGFADPDPQSLNQFLKNFCVLDAQDAQICDGFISPPGSHEQFVNLGRISAFVGNALTVSVELPDLNVVRDLLAQGYPVLLALSLSSQGTPAGGHYVVATGVAPDGSIAIMDPNPAFGKTNLHDYLAGFNGLQATLAGAVRLIPQAPPTPGFLVVGDPVFDISSPAGGCGTNLDLPAIAAVAGVAPNSMPPLFRFRFCDGAQAQYELEVSSSGPFQLTLTDLGNPGNRVDLSGAGATAFAVGRPGAQWSASVQALSFTAQGVVNAASFTPDLAPGGLFSVFGSGLARAGTNTMVEVGGVAAAVVGQSPFQVNAQVPPVLGPGTYTLKMASAYGNMQQSIEIHDVAPAIFQLSAQLFAITDRNGVLISPDNPANRGGVIVVYCTGLGAVVGQGSLQVAQTPVTGLIGGTPVKPAFAGLTPGFIGLYQVNLPIAANTPPGLGISVILKQGSSTSNTAQVAVQ